MLKLQFFKNILKCKLAHIVPTAYIKPVYTKPAYIIPAYIIIFFILILQVSCCFCFDLKSDEQVSVEETTDTGAAGVKIIGQAIDVKVQGDYAYLTNDLGMLYVIDVRDKENPAVVGRCTGIDSANIVMLDGDYAYVSYTSWMSTDETTDGQEGQEKENKELLSVCGFKIIDIKDKKNPQVAGDFISGKNENKSVQGLVIDGDYAYLNSTKLLLDSADSRLEIIDIKNKNNPKLVGFCNIDGQPNGLFVRDNYAYINNVYFDFKIKEYSGRSSFIVVDVKDKKKPEVVSSCEVPANSWSVYVKDNFAYLTSNLLDEETKKYKDSMLQIVDISNPLKPLPAGSCSTTGGAWEMDMRDNFLFVSSLEGGINTVDVSDSQNPVVVSIFKTSGISYDIAVSGDYGYIADGFGGLSIIELGIKEPEGGLIVEDSDRQLNRAPVAGLDIFGDKTFMDTYIAGNPVYFSALDSYDPEGAALSYNWEVDGSEIKDLETPDDFSTQLLTGYPEGYILSKSREKLACFFNEPGKYNVKLTVSDGVLEDSVEITVNVEMQGVVIEPVKEHNFNVIIECLLTNTSSIKLKNIECYIRTPQDYYPFQVINKITPEITTDVVSIGRIFDDEWNLLTHFKFDKSLSVGKGVEFSSSITADVTMYEYDFKRIETKGMDYEYPDEDLLRYTQEDLYIDCNNPVIIDAAKKAAGGETDPVKMAKKIYNYVANKLYYDFPRAKEKDYKLMNASEILKTGKGVCTDYSILYIAMLRASEIPSRFIGGIPVTLILGQKDNQLDIGHAWVEVKLPGYGWIPVDITQEKGFMNTDYFLNLATEKGMGYLYGSLTMDWSSYYFDGFRYKWDGMNAPKSKDVEQTIIYRIEDLSLKDIKTLN